MEELNELKNLVMQNLEKNGYLSNIRAQIRSSVFKTIDSQEGSSKKISLPPLRPLLSILKTSKSRNWLKVPRGRTLYNSSRNSFNSTKWNILSKSSPQSQTWKRNPNVKNWVLTMALKLTTTSPFSIASFQTTSPKTRSPSLKKMREAKNSLRCLSRWRKTKVKVK